MKPADPRMPEIADAPKRESSLFAEMQRKGIIDAKMKAVGAPPRMAVPETGQAQAQNQGLPQLPGFVSAQTDLPRLPTAAPVRTADITTPPVLAPSGLPQLPKAAQGVISQPAPRAVPVEQAFAAEPVAAPRQIAAAAPVQAQSWKPAAPQIAQADTVGRAPVAPVERAELPSVRSNTVVPLRIAEKKTDDRPAVVEPVAVAPMPITPTRIAANPGAAPDLPPLPQLPGSYSAPAAQPAPVAASALPPPPPPAAAKPVVQPVAAAKPAAQPAVQQPAPAPKMAQPAAMQPPKPAAKPVAAAKPAAKPTPAGKLAGMAPSAAPAQPGSARYLVIHSFTDQQKASQTAQKYGHLGATVTTAQIQGQTWYRVVVRDGAAQREKLTADGVRVYWPVSL